jgi:hypothetical protein
MHRLNVELGTKSIVSLAISIPTAKYHYYKIYMNLLPLLLTLRTCNKLHVYSTFDSRTSALPPLFNGKLNTKLLNNITVKSRSTCDRERLRASCVGICSWWQTCCTPVLEWIGMQWVTKCLYFHTHWSHWSFFFSFPWWGLLGCCVTFPFMQLDVREQISVPDNYLILRLEMFHKQSARSSSVSN